MPMVFRGLPHCDDAGHEMVDGHCIRTTHAEANAIVQAAKNGVKINESEIYVTASPCYYCFKLIFSRNYKLCSAAIAATLTISAEEQPLDRSCTGFLRP